MDIHQLISAYADSLTAGDNKSEEILSKIANLSIDFIGWQEIYLLASSSSDLQALAVAKLVELASTVEEWGAVYLLNFADSNHKEIALKKIRQMNS